mmetsp:Transcript_12513/g.52451  ORF Transcript_12513/g.52451 Transcript_12513/m.52451 type:complete len:242 (+) Transcript_12513:612-1337(+)
MRQTTRPRAIPKRMTFPGARRTNSSATRRAARRRPPRRQPLHPPTPSTPRLLSRNTCASSSWTSSTRRASSRSSPRTNTTRSPTRKATRTTGPTRRRRRRRDRARFDERGGALFRRATRQSSTATITNTVYHKYFFAVYVKPRNTVHGAFSVFRPDASPNLSSSLRSVSRSAASRAAPRKTVSACATMSAWLTPRTSDSEARPSSHTALCTNVALSRNWKCPAPAISTPQLSPLAARAKSR